MKEILMVGGGFAGIGAAMTAAHEVAQANGEVSITLVSRDPYMPIRQKVCQDLCYPSCSKLVEREDRMMHRFRTALGLVLVLFLFVAVACTGEQGPAGPAGPQGEQGPAGPASVAGGSLAPFRVRAVAGDISIPGPGVLDPAQGTGNLLPGTSSQLVRTNKGLSITINTTGLAPGAYTTWWVIDEQQPGTYAKEFEVLINAGGGTVGPDGEFNFTGFLPVDVLPDVDWVKVLRNGDGEFDTPWTARVQVVVRNHGPVVEALAQAQATEWLGGCSNTAPPGAGEYTSGTFVCYDPQWTFVHEP